MNEIPSMFWWQLSGLFVSLLVLGTCLYLQAYCTVRKWSVGWRAVVLYTLALLGFLSGAFFFLALLQ